MSRTEPLRNPRKARREGLRGEVDGLRRSLQVKAGVLAHLLRRVQKLEEQLAAQQGETELQELAARNPAIASALAARDIARAIDLGLLPKNYLHPPGCPCPHCLPAPPLDAVPDSNLFPAVPKPHLALEIYRERVRAFARSMGVPFRN
jgi:hypothetical protein